MAAVGTAGAEISDEPAASVLPIPPRRSSTDAASAGPATQQHPGSMQQSYQQPQRHHRSPLELAPTAIMPASGAGGNRGQHPRQQTPLHAPRPFHPSPLPLAPLDARPGMLACPPPVSMQQLRYPPLQVSPSVAVRQPMDRINHQLEQQPWLPGAGAGVAAPGQAWRPFAGGMIPGSMPNVGVPPLYLQHQEPPPQAIQLLGPLPAVYAQPEGHTMSPSWVGPVLSDGGPGAMAFDARGGGGGGGGGMQGGWGGSLRWP